MSRCHALALFVLSCLLAASTAPAAAQSDATPCDAPGADQFDFWLGTWELAWGEDGRGTNTIKRILGGCIIEESFEGMMKSGPYRGLSVTAYDPETDQWRQTWVDDQGEYLDFVGAKDGDRMVLQRTTTMASDTIEQRMVWHNITADSLDWMWQKSEDGGQTWTTLWAIHYVRRK